MNLLFTGAGNLITRLTRFSLLLGLKSMRYVFYPTKVSWIHPPPRKPWKDVQLIIILNHTSLLECLLGGIIPISYLWKMAGQLLFPVAEETLRRPIIGNLLKRFAPQVLPLTRNRDHSWDSFMDSINPKKMILVFVPEGRMKRKTGLDKEGLPMRVRTGVFDVLKKFEDSKVLMVFSGGLHHIYAPEDKIPKLFKNIKVSLGLYKASDLLAKGDGYKEIREKKRQVSAYLDQLRDEHCPQSIRCISGGR